MSRNSLTYSQLAQLLQRLGFQGGKRTDSCEAYYHAESDTLILLPAADPKATACPADLASVRVRLVNNGIVEDAAFAGFLDNGTLPLAS